MRLVLDCNVLVAAARNDGTCRRVVLEAVRRHEIVVSPPILEEYRDVGGRPKHRSYYETMVALTALLEQVASKVEPVPMRFGLTDPDDEVYLATAVAGRAEMLVTGNAKDFAGPSAHGVRIVSPRTFLTGERG